MHSRSLSRTHTHTHTHQKEKKATAPNFAQERSFAKKAARLHAYLKQDANYEPFIRFHCFKAEEQGCDVCGGDDDGDGDDAGGGGRVESSTVLS